MLGVQNLKKKHKRFENELASHEPAIQSVHETGQHLIQSSQHGGPEIEARLKQLSDVWEELKVFILLFLRAF